MGSLSQAVDAAEREVGARPADAAAWERLGRLRLRALRPRGRARRARARPRARRRPRRGCSTSRSWPTWLGDVGAEVRACEQATRSYPESPAAWARLRPRAGAHRPHRRDCLAACERALELADDPEVRDLREQVARIAPRELRATSPRRRASSRGSRPPPGGGRPRREQQRSSASRPPGCAATCVCRSSTTSRAAAWAARAARPGRARRRTAASGECPGCAGLASGSPSVNSSTRRRRRAAPCVSARPRRCRSRAGRRPRRRGLSAVERERRGMAGGRPQQRALGRPQGGDDRGDELGPGPARSMSGGRHRQSAPGRLWSARRSPARCAGTLAPRRLQAVADDVADDEHRRVARRGRDEREVARDAPSAGTKHVARSSCCRGGGSTGVSAPWTRGARPAPDPGRR